jgi:hypothetical protein
MRGRAAPSGAINAVGLSRARFTANEARRRIGGDTLNAALAGVDLGLDAFTIHDLRRTMRTHLSSLGIRSEVAERRAALETWTALLLEIERGEGRVAPLRSSRSNS